MAEPKPHQLSYQFGAFHFDPRANELYKSGLRVRVQKQPLQILRLLLERRGEVVTREELRERLWPGDVYVDFERGLNNAVVRLREALSDSAGSPRFIETLPRTGYRFIASLNESVVGTIPSGTSYGHKIMVVPAKPQAAPESKLDPAVASPSVPNNAGAESLSGVPKRTKAITFAVAFGIALVAILALAAVRQRLFARRSGPPIQSVAVLPLANLSGDAGQDYFADGMTDALITDLAQMGSLKVISRTSVMRFKGTQMPLGQVARELHVDGVVEGSVVRSGTRVRITAQLLDAAADRHIWAKSYERDLGDMLIVQSEISRAIASEINVRLTPQESARLATAPQANPDAYQAYLLGRFHWNRGDKENLLRSIEYYEQALAKDPGNALAYAGIADSYSYLSDWYQRPLEAMPKAKAAAVKALELNESLAAAHNSLCYIQESYDWDWDGAEKECRRAIQLNPSFAEAHDNYATLLAYVGRVKESAEELKRAEELDPLSFHIYTDGEFSFFLARDYARAEEQAKRAIELEPDYFLAHSYLGLVYAEMGRAKEAVAEAEKGASLTDSPLIEGFMGYTYAASGKKEAARKIAKDLVKKRASEYVCAFEIGTIHLRLGEREQALPWFEKAFDEKSLCITSIKFDPRLDPVRDDPRFKSLLERAGFPKD